MLALRRVDQGASRLTAFALYGCGRRARKVGLVPCGSRSLAQGRAVGPHKAIALRAMTLLKILSPKRGVGDAPF